MNKKNTIIAVFVILLLLFGLGWYGFGRKYFQGQFNKEPIRIGASIPLTGPVSILGTWGLEGMNLAAEEINSQGGINGRSIKLIVEDDKCNANDGVNTVTKLLNVDEVKALIVYCGAVTGAVADIIDNKALTYSISVRTEPLENKYPFLFNLSPGPGKEMAVLAQRIYDDGIQKIAILHQADFFGEIYKNKFIKAFNYLGGQITLTGSLENLVNPDFKTDLMKIKDNGSEAIFTSFNVAQYAVILKQAKELGLNVKFFSSWNTESQLLLDTAGDLTEGIVYTYFFKKGASPNYGNFSRAYETKYGRTAETNAANSYDAVMLMAKALRMCGERVDCLIEQTSAVKNYPGVSGEITFQQGVADKKIYLKTIRAGQFEFLDNSEQ